MANSKNIFTSLHILAGYLKYTRSRTVDAVLELRFVQEKMTLM